MQQPAGILFTAFEPSGDALAAPLIAELRSREPDRPIYVMGGARMCDAGADMIENTTFDAVMGVPPVRKVFEHRERMTRLRAWMRGKRLAAVVPTDSPAANWSVCEAARELHPSAKIIHLAAPQLWAWAPWRIRKMRHLSDHVLCLLPFEPDWFGTRGVPGTFVGHPIFQASEVETAATDLPAGSGVKLAVLPGSRPSEVESNLPMMLDILERLEHPAGVDAIIAASDEQREAQIQSLIGQRGAAPASSSSRGAQATVVKNRIRDVLVWADVVLAVSGTVTLQVAAQRKPMVIVYNANPLMWHGVGRWIVSTRTFTLPNLIGQWLGMSRRVPEFVPHFGNPEPVLHALRPLLEEGEARQKQRELFDAIHETFHCVDFTRSAADVVERLLT